MKTLQNNFTTREQSKRLLELGVPADSADMYFLNSLKFPYFLTRSFGEEMANTPDDVSKIPCWSVGRLIEICKICSNVPIDWTGGLNEKREILEVVYSTLFALCLCDHMDFSKLEE